MQADLLVQNIGQLVRVASADGLRVGQQAMNELAILEKGSVAVRDGRIAWLGASKDSATDVTAEETVDAEGRCVVPGFVDSHTHLMYAGSRVEEFAKRVGGASYLEIMAAGGGIMSTVRATRAAGPSQLLREAAARLDRMLSHGTTTSEVKTGYGLSVEGELRLLSLILELDKVHPIDLVPTFMGAHAVPEEYAGREDAYVDLVVTEMLPAVAEHAEAAGRSIFCDVFCDDGAFSLEQSRRVLEAASALGLGLKIHADEFSSLGASELAAELGATSADHLVRTPAAEWGALARAGTVAVLLPGTTFGLGHVEFAPGRAMIDHGLSVALATDLNPGTAWCEALPFIQALACRYLSMAPAEALVASTIHAAHAIGLGEAVGSLEVGKLADFLILEAQDYREISYRFGTNPVDRVFKRGELVWSADRAARR
ncbi:MAG: imidazolonepropionase [Anaerolineae bacterium]